MKTKRLLCMLILSALLPLTVLADVWQDPKTKVNYEFITHPQNSSKRGNVMVYAAKIIRSPEATGDIEIGYFVMDDDWEMGLHPVTSIDDYAFRDCEGITSVTMNLQSMEEPYSIGMGAFMDCSGLKSVTQLPYGRFDINVSEAAFLGCTSLESVDFLTLRSIGSNAFRDCSSLTSVTLPSFVTSIGSRAFQGCTGLKEVCAEMEPFDIEDNVFSTATYNVPLCVLAGMKAKYEALEGWKNFRNIVEPSNLRIADNDPFISRQKGYPHIEDDANTWCNRFYDFWRKEKHDVIHIYNTKELAVLSDPTHLLYWNDAVDLEEVLTVHGNHGVRTDVPMDLRQLGLSWKFEVEDYDIKEYDPEAWGNTIYESQHAWLDGNLLKACMTSGGQRNPSWQSRSSIGRKPLLKVQLVDSEGTVKCEGYIKFLIADGMGTMIEEVECDVASAQKSISYDDATRGVKYEFGWNEIKEQVLSAIFTHGVWVSNYQFDSNYCLGMPATSNYYESSISGLGWGPASLPMQPFVSYGDLWVLPSLYDEIVGAEIPSSYLYGSFAFNKYDSQNREVENISWTLSDAQAQWLQSHGGAKVALRLYDPNFSGYPEICLVFSMGKQGDVNGDGIADVADIAAVIDVMAKGKNDNKKADVNGDGTVDVADIASVIDIMAGGGDNSGDDDEYTVEAASDMLYACVEGDAVTANWNEVEEQILDMLNRHGAMSKSEFEVNYTLDNKVYGLSCIDDQGNWTLPGFESASYGSIVFNEDSGQFGIQFQGSELMALLSHRNAKGEYTDSLGNVAKSMCDRALYPYVDYKVAVRLKSSGYDGRPDVLVTFSARIYQRTATMNRPTSASYGNWYSVAGRYGGNVQFLNASIDPFTTGPTSYAYDVRRMQLNLQENLKGQRWLASQVDDYPGAFDFHFDNITGTNAETRISAEKAKLRELHGDLYFYTDNWLGDVEEGTPYWHDALKTPTINDDKFYADRYLIKACYSDNPTDTVTVSKGKLGKYLFAYKFIETEYQSDWGYTEIMATPDMADGQMIAYIDNIDTRAFDSGMAPKADFDGNGRPNKSVNVHFCWESTFMRDLLNRAGRYAENNSLIQDGYSKATDNPFTTHVHLSLCERNASTDTIPVKLTNPDFCIRPLRPLNVEFTTPWDSYSISTANDAASGMTTVTINYNELFRSKFPMDWQGSMAVKDQTAWIQFYQGKAANGSNTWNATDTYYTFMDNDRSSYDRGSSGRFYNWNGWYYTPSTNGQYADSWNSMTVVPQMDHILTNYGGTEGFWQNYASILDMQCQHTYDPVTGNIISTTFKYLNDGAFDIIIPVTVKYAWGDITTTGKWESTDNIFRTNDRYYHNANMNCIRVHINTAAGY